MAERRFKELSPETMTPEQKKVADAIQSGPRGAGLRGPFNALLRSPDLCDLVQRVGAYVRYSSSIPARLNEMGIIMAGRKWTAQYEFYAHRKLAIDAGVAERLVRQLELEAQLMLRASIKTFDELGLSDDQRDRGLAIMSRALLELEAAEVGVGD